MGSSRVRVEAFDRNGNRFTVSLEGRLSREKVVQVLDMIELMGGLPSERGSEVAQLAAGLPTKLEMVRSLIPEALPAEWFSSKDLQSAYEQAFGEPIAATTSSTYLQRLTLEGFLLRSGTRAARRYKLNLKPDGDPTARPKQPFRNSSARQP